jgi:hypothetical protein
VRRNCRFAGRGEKNQYDRSCYENHLRVTKVVQFFQQCYADLRSIRISVGVKLKPE